MQRKILSRIGIKWVELLVFASLAGVVAFGVTYEVLLLREEVQKVNPHRKPPAHSSQPPPKVIQMDCYARCPVCKGNGFMIGIKGEKEKPEGIEDVMFFPCEHCTGMVKLQRF